VVTAGPGGSSSPNITTATKLALQPHARRCCVLLARTARSAARPPAG
jgi:hypothetical protein